MSGQEQPHDLTPERVESEKRKFHLVKCDRCRLDKQKCTPTTRIWPKKCDRCEKKGFPCSTGRRVERKSKHTTASQEPSSDYSEIKLRLDTMIFLQGFYEINLKHFERHGRVRKEMLHPFPELVCLEYEHKLPQSKNEETLIKFLESISATINDMRNLLLIDSSVSGCEHTTVAALLMSHVLFPLYPHGICPFCDESTRHKEVLEDLQDRRSVCAEFQMRLARLAKALEFVEHLQAHQVKIATESARLKALWSMIMDRFKDTTCEGIYMAPTNLSVSSFMPDQAAFIWLNSEWSGIQDSVERKSALDWLTSMPPWLEWTQPLYRSELVHRLESMMKYTEDLELKDNFGRTFLHIVCIKDWYAGAETLLKHGANPDTLTIFGSLPLHYAAANGSIAMCELLLEKMKIYNSDVNQLDKAGLSAQDYAIRSGNTMIVETLQRNNVKETLPSSTAGFQNGSANVGQQAYLQAPLFHDHTPVQSRPYLQQHYDDNPSASGSAASAAPIEKSPTSADYAKYMSQQHLLLHPGQHPRPQPVPPLSMLDPLRFSTPLDHMDFFG